MKKYLGLGVFALSGLGTVSVAAQNNTPNVLFILLDDLAYDAIQSSNRYPFLKTPAINRLQEEGVTFTNFFCTMSLSSPSRACFLTGVYPHIHGVTQNHEKVDPDWEAYPSYNQILQKKGYETAFIGKLHNAAMDGQHQVRPGYDYWLGFKGQGRYQDPELNENGRDFVETGYMTDILTEYATSWLKNRANKQKPFSMCLWHKAVHGPFHPASRHKGMYSQDSLPLPPLGNGVETFENKPEWQKYKKSFYQIWDKDPLWNPRFQEPIDILETLQAVDESINKVYQTLQEIGQLDNTLIIFSGDNGYFMGEHGFWDKRISYDECLRIPMVMRYPAMIEPGSVIEDMCLNIDVMPTLLSLAQEKVPDYVQGESLLPLLKGERVKDWRKSFLFEYFVDDAYPYAGPTQVAVRTTDFKLVDNNLEDDIDELYDLRNDPGEMINLIDNPDFKYVKRNLEEELIRLKKELKYNENRDFWLHEAIENWETKQQ